MHPYIFWIELEKDRKLIRSCTKGKNRRLEECGLLLSAFAWSLASSWSACVCLLSSLISEGCCFILWTKKGQALGRMSETARKEWECAFKSTHNGFTQRREDVLGPLKRLFHTMFNHQKSLPMLVLALFWVGSAFIYKNFQIWFLSFSSPVHGDFPSSWWQSTCDFVGDLNSSLKEKNFVFDIFPEVVGWPAMQTQIKISNSLCRVFSII